MKWRMHCAGWKEGEFIVALQRRELELGLNRYFFCGLSAVSQLGILQQSQIAVCAAYDATRETGCRGSNYFFLSPNFMAA